MSKTPVQTVHADFPHTAYQVVAQVAALRGPRILNGSAQAVESQGFEEGTVPSGSTTGPKARPRPLDEQGVETIFDESIHLDKFHRGIARAKVLAPAAQHRIDIRNDATNIRMAPRAGGQLAHTQAHPRHRARRRPALEIVDATTRPLPQWPTHALAQMAAEKVETLASTREIDRPRLLRMELEPEPREHEAHPTSRFLDVRFRVAHDHKIIRVADQCPEVSAPVFPHAIEDVQVDVREQR